MSMCDGGEREKERGEERRENVKELKKKKN